MGEQNMKRGETEEKGRERSKGKLGRTEERERRETEVKQTRRREDIGTMGTKQRQ